ncbi:MAG: hypothetical protein KBS70_03355 [Bacteroidales bacterium]|nr:hypothetical protein [Candidatus Colicola equi]
MKTLVITLMLLFLLIIVCSWYIVSHGDVLFEEEKDPEPELPKDPEMASGSDVCTRKKKFSRITSKSPAIEVPKYIYTKYYNRKH